MVILCVLRRMVNDDVEWECSHVLVVDLVVVGLENLVMRTVGFCAVIKRPPPDKIQSIVKGDEPTGEKTPSSLPSSPDQRLRTLLRRHSLMSALTESDKTVHADFYNRFGDLNDDNDLN